MNIDRVNSEIAKELSQIINYELKDPRVEGVMPGITRVDTTKDLKYCKVFVSVVSTSADKKEVIKVLQASASFMRTELFHRLKIRAVPEFTFVLDDSVEYSMKIEKILKDLKG